MSQSSLLLQTLKACLKQSGITYADIAANLELSEASVKRIFAEENISLKRFESICTMLNMTFADLAKSAEKSQESIIELSEEQEAEFVKQPKLLMLAYMLLNEVELDSILTNYQLDKHEAIQLLAHLDRIKFIDLLPGNRIKLKVSRNFKWRKNGAIEKLFNQTIRQEFLQSRFAKKDEHIQFAGALVSRSTLLHMHDKLDRLQAEFNELAKNDAKLAFDERTGCGIVAAVRPFELSLFAQFRK